MSAKKKGLLFPIRKNGPLLYLIHLLLGAAKVTCLLLCNICCATKNKRISFVSMCI